MRSGFDYVNPSPEQGACKRVHSLVGCDFKGINATFLSDWHPDFKCSQNMTKYLRIASMLCSNIQNYSFVESSNLLTSGDVVFTTSLGTRHAVQTTISVNQPLAEGIWYYTSDTAHVFRTRRFARFLNMIRKYIERIALPQINAKLQRITLTTPLCNTMAGVYAKVDSTIPKKFQNERISFQRHTLFSLPIDWTKDVFIIENSEKSKILKLTKPRLIRRYRPRITGKKRSNMDKTYPVVDVLKSTYLLGIVVSTLSGFIESSTKHEIKWSESPVGVMNQQECLFTTSLHLLRAGKCS